MEDNRVIAPIGEDFQFTNQPTPTVGNPPSAAVDPVVINPGGAVPPNVQYLDQIPQTVSTTTAATGGDTGALNPLLAPDVGTLGNLTLMDLVQMLVVYAFIIAAALAAIFIFIGGVSFILSGGNDEKIKQAINTIRYSIIGLIVTILSFTFVAIVGRMFGLNFMDFLSYEKIRNDINRIVQPFSAQDQNTFEVRN